MKIIRHEIGNANNISDPTYALVLKKLTPVRAIVLGKRILKRPEDRLNVIESTKEWCVNGVNTKKTCTALGVSTDFYYRTLEKIRIHAALVAAYLHLIQV